MRICDDGGGAVCAAAEAQRDVFRGCEISGISFRPIHMLVDLQSMLRIVCLTGN